MSAAAADPPSLASSAAAAADAAAAAGASAGSVFVKRAGDASARFARVPILVGDAVTDLAKRASLERGWGVDAAYVDLFLVRTDCARRIERGDESEGVGDALFSGDRLATIGVVDGAFLLACLSSPPAAAPGECARARLAASFSLIEQGAGGSRDVPEIPLGSSLGAHPLLVSLSIFCRRRRRRWRQRRRRRRRV